MTISLLCVTDNTHNVDFFIYMMREAADKIGAEFVLGLDRQQAQTARWRSCADKAIDLTARNLQEDVLDDAIGACSGDYVFRIDDDETLSPALIDWLARREYERDVLFSFPRVYLYPDMAHYLTNDGMYPDRQTRCGLKHLMLGCNLVHAANPNGGGIDIDLAIEHHKMLVRSLDERLKICQRYESLKPGAGTLPQYARYNVPEMFYTELIYQEYKNHGDFSAR